MRAVPIDARYEVKFVTDSVNKPQLLRWLKLNPAAFRSAFDDRWINNLYFDTKDYVAYSENLAGSSSRTKCRLRWYGPLNESDHGYLEIKHRRSCYGWKERADVAWTGISDIENWAAFHQSLVGQSDGNFRALVDYFSQPVLINRYQREYYISADGLIRTTVDTELDCWDQRFASSPSLLRKANNVRVAVVEVKFSREHRHIAADVLKYIPLRVSRHSKYVTGLAALAHG